MSFFFYYLISCTLLQYCNKFTVTQIKLVAVVVVVVGNVKRNRLLDAGQMQEAQKMRVRSE